MGGIYGYSSMNQTVISRLKSFTYTSLRRSEAYFKTDMVYLFRAGFWNNLNAFILALLSLVLYIAFAHFLSKETYGTYQYLLSFFSIATALTLTGMNNAVVRAVAQGYEGTMRASVMTQLRWGVLPLAGSLLCAAYYGYMGNSLLALGLVVIAVCTPLLYAFNTYNTLFMGRKDFSRATILSTGGYILYYGVLVVAAILSASPLEILMVNLISQVLIFYALYRYTLAVHRPNTSVDTEALSYGLHLSAMGVIGSVAGQMGNIFIFHFLGPAALAIYSFASAGPERLGGICFKFLGSAVLPKFAERTVEEIRAELTRKLLWATLAGVVVMLFYWAIASPFFLILFPNYYHDALPYSYAIAVGLVLGAGIQLPLAALTALKHTRSLYIFNIANPIVQIVFPLTGILVGGLWGMVVGHLLTIVFAMVLLTLLVYKADK